MPSRARADQLVFEQGLAQSREQARRLIMAGRVFTGAPPVRVEKPGHGYAPGTLFSLVEPERFVSRGAYKLLTALEHFAIKPDGCVCLDAGASAGGFTDCLLQHGAARVYAVDVGQAQLHERLKNDARVISREGINLRVAPPQCIPEPVDLLVADLSFISLTLVLPNCMQWLKERALVIALVKPQFELAPHQVKKGVVRDTALQQEAVDRVRAFCETRLGLSCLGVVPAALRGPKGNQEYLACFRREF
ncbi:MAG: TlyA family RNA methyltransferase [Deltaproteobacteria bacterium]|jgi:23S rRNA (cytidine1920-2'-O)/16S rRNA (cytidine1409-2'-O)-methyltransferase|nr:TlyA family RNA methyltransferase [Deltaproteobacteria bacterium]